MSEKLENEQAKTTQGLAATTASIKQMDGTQYLLATKEHILDWKTSLEFCR